MEITETTIGSSLAESEVVPEVQPEQPIETQEQPAQEVAPEQPPVINNSSDFELPGETETTQTETPQTNDWKTVLKGVDKKELFKELDIPELDDFDKEFINYRKNGGDPYKYLEAKGIDWTGVKDEDLVKADLKRQYPDATQVQLERKFNKLYDQYENASEEEKEDGLLSMKSDARRLREKLITEQKSFQIPAYAQPEQAAQLKQIAEQQAAAQQQTAALTQYIHTSEATKNLLADKRVTMDLGDGLSFNFNVKEPQKLVNIVLNPELSSKLTRTPEGQLDVSKLYMTSLFLANPQKFARDLVNYGKTLKVDEQVSEGQNAGIPPVKPIVQSQVSEKEAWKKAQDIPLGQLLKN